MLKRLLITTAAVLIPVSAFCESTSVTVQIRIRIPEILEISQRHCNADSKLKLANNKLTQTKEMIRDGQKILVKTILPK